MDRLFRQSGLMRPKWDERHSARGETYGQMTIAKALVSAREVYAARSNLGQTENGATSPVAAEAKENEPHPLTIGEQIAELEQMVAAIPQDVDKLQLSFLLHPLLENLAKQDKAFATTFLARKVKEHFRLTRVEMTAYESSLAKLRKEWKRAEQERKANEAALAREHAAQSVEISDAEYAEAMEFLRDTRIAERIAEDITALGYVGEEFSKVTAYLVASSRKQDHPLSAVIKSPSAYGKSEEVKTVAAMMPPEDVREFTRLTPQALTYMPRDGLKHKLMIVTEREGSEASDYTIRVMQSEQKIRIAYPTRDPETGEMHTEEHEVNGPMAYIETTTRPMIHSENATRVFELYLDGSERQTRQVHTAQRKNATLAGLRGKKQRAMIMRRHQNSQRLLQPMEVVIPYAEFIDFPAENPRTRRDLPRLLELIKVTAFLRQFQKERHRDVDLDTGEKLEYIEADLGDYAIAYRYAAPAIAQGLDELPKHSRELLDKIRIMVREKIEAKDGVKQFTRRDIRVHCHVTDKFVKDYVRALEDTEYLEVVSGDGGRGKKYIYQLPDAMLNESEGPVIVKGLTTPEELAEMIRRAGSK